MKTPIHIYTWVIALIGLHTLGFLAFMIGWAIQQGLWMESVILFFVLLIFSWFLGFLATMAQKLMAPE
jgi:hypothetical protein